MDFGGKEWVDVSSLRQLPDGLADLPPFAVCCQLANVEPVKTRDSDSADWSQTATDYLMNATNDKPFTAWLDESLPIGSVIRYSFLHVITLIRSPLCQRLCVQYRLMSISFTLTEFEPAPNVRYSMSELQNRLLQNVSPRRLMRNQSGIQSLNLQVCLCSLTKPFSPKC